MEYKEFKVVIKNRKSIEITKPNQITVSGDVQIDTLTERTINIFSKWLADDKIKTREELVVLGTYLFNILFDKETKEVFKTEYKKIEGLATGLRVVLEFTSDARDLAVLPWEYIYYPDSPEEEGRGFFIATDNQLILARHVPLKMQGLAPGPKPLRILIVVSTPTRDEDGEKELGIIKEGPVIEAIEGLKNNLKDVIQIDKFTQPTKNSLTKWIQDNERYHVVHFVGHGKYEKNTGFLALTDANNPKRAAWIKDETLADCFRKREPRLIFLNACEGAYSESYAAFRGVALQMVYSNIPAVVAMQYEVENKVANRFAVKFYQSLGEGKPIDVAVQDGRLELGMFLDEGQNYSNRAFGSPVVYLQSAAGIIIAEAQSKEERDEREEQPPSSEDLVRCPNYRLGCDGKVYLDDIICLKCRDPLMKCPKCRKLMSKKIGICPSCAYGVEAEADKSAAERIPELRDTQSQRA